MMDGKGEHSLIWRQYCYYYYYYYYTITMLVTSTTTTIRYLDIYSQGGGGI